MHQKDYILRQIEMLSLILLKLTKQLDVSHNDHDVLEANDELLKNSNIDIQALILIPENELKDYLTQQDVLVDSFIDLAKYLRKLAAFSEHSNPTLVDSYKTTANSLVKIAEEETGNAFFGM